jgi:spore coat protein CotH
MKEMKEMKEMKDMKDMKDMKEVNDNEKYRKFQILKNHFNDYKKRYQTFSSYIFKDLKKFIDKLELVVN